MARDSDHGDDGAMDDLRSHPDQAQALQRSAHELQRAAGNLVKNAAGAASVPALSVALAHVEEALDRLSVGMLLAARAVATSRARGTPVDEAAAPPETEALCFHLRRAAEKLHHPQAACEASRMWTRRVLEAETDSRSALGAINGA